ncbi:hypothetical protein HOY82DRAFT_601120 [Tuber indicum]|nr:hypothetical protein HOY82DRAFT_601120 [Tuber indicum]
MNGSEQRLNAISSQPATLLLLMEQMLPPSIALNAETYSADRKRFVTSLKSFTLPIAKFDGLRKHLRKYDPRLCHNNLRSSYNEPEVNQRLYSAAGYITEITRFDRSKCIPDIIEPPQEQCARVTRDVPGRLPHNCYSVEVGLYEI